MAYVARNCSFQEARSRPFARIFALCDLGGGLLSPIPRPRDQPTVQGILSLQRGTRLHVKFDALPSSVKRILVGIYLPTNHDFSEEDYRLRLTFSDGSSRTMHGPIEDSAGKHYALLATVTRPAKRWIANRLDPPELFDSKNDLSEAYSVPAWWLKRS